MDPNSNQKQIESHHKTPTQKFAACKGWWNSNQNKQKEAKQGSALLWPDLWFSDTMGTMPATLAVLVLAVACCSAPVVAEVTAPGSIFWSVYGGSEINAGETSQYSIETYKQLYDNTVGVTGLTREVDDEASLSICKFCCVCFFFFFSKAAWVQMCARRV